MSDDDSYEDFEHVNVPDDCCPFHPEGDCEVEDHFSNPGPQR
ncbi:hypothetical protein [Streptomyces sp. NRRL F-5135]|nr:hypothetical protein [Streptomyces sp. NRRL F-5135]